MRHGRSALQSASGLDEVAPPDVFFWCIAADLFQNQQGEGLLGSSLAGGDPLCFQNDLIRGVQVHLPWTVRTTVGTY